MADVAPSRLAALIRLRCNIFQTVYNPTGIRTGAKYLRARLRGPSMMSYYPPTLNIARVAKMYPELELADEDEEQRLQDIEDRKRRGKSAPKKAKTKGTNLDDVSPEILSKCKPNSHETLGENHRDTSILVVHSTSVESRIQPSRPTPIGAGSRPVSRDSDLFNA
ncbi:mitochondrial ribosomal subunit S27-domain-containing protein [Rhodocollybia butyracea]|uniref:Small ribosomal subunit protein mS33 n=1 Tax=Rhodocollybia butyracea TaxID=206335 RepID=A0A9P5QBQ8_9AGAR|nr:mitochondrial ribosomal subunit S27-domain-containing protein [Rhodocollybia butyracea]